MYFFFIPSFHRSVELRTKKKYSRSRPQSNHPFSQHATEGQLETFNNY